MVQLKKIDRENVWDVARLKVKRAQKNYVSSKCREHFGGVCNP